MEEGERGGEERDGERDKPASHHQRILSRGTEKNKGRQRAPDCCCLFSLYNLLLSCNFLLIEKLQEFPDTLPPDLPNMNISPYLLYPFIFSCTI